MVRKLGIAGAVAVPLITSLVAPSSGVRSKRSSLSLVLNAAREIVFGACQIGTSAIKLFIFLRKLQTELKRGRLKKALQQYRCEFYPHGFRWGWWKYLTDNVNGSANRTAQTISQRLGLNAH